MRGPGDHKGAWRPQGGVEATKGLRDYSEAQGTQWVPVTRGPRTHNGVLETTMGPGGPRTTIDPIDHNGSSLQQNN